MSWGKNLPNFKTAQPIRVYYQIGGLMDIPTGSYVRGARGEWLLNGGIASFEGTAGPGNSSKSTFCDCRILTAMHRYELASGFKHDTENSAALSRAQMLANEIDPTGTLAATLDEDVGRYMLTNAETYDGTEWFDLLKKFAAERVKTEKKIDTPFVDKHGKPIQVYTPIFGFLDSLSQFRSSAVQEKIDKEKVGSSKLNTIYMQGGATKTIVVDEMPSITGKSGISMMMSAHMGDTIVMDEYNPPAKKLGFLKGTRKMKKTPESFTFLPNNLFEIVNLSKLLNRQTKAAEFPLNEMDDMEGNVDLMVMTVLPLRGKSGSVGIPFELIVSQRYGLQPTLSEFWYIKNNDRYGLGTNVVHNELDLYPGVKFTRQKIRTLINEDPKFCRAMQITADLAQMCNYWPDFAVENITFTPAQLYEKLKADGYDWDELLSTRSYWTFDEYTNPVHGLSTRTLIDMYHGRDKPWWKKDEYSKTR